MSEVSYKEPSFLSELLKANHSVVNESAFLNTLRSKAIEQVNNLPFPTARTEEWRQFPLKSLIRNSYKASNDEVVESQDVSSTYFVESEKSRIVLVNGSYYEKESDVSGLSDGIYAGPISSLPLEIVDKIESRFGTIAKNKDDAFTPFNTATFKDAVVVYVPKELKEHRPLHIVHVTAGDNVFTSPRTFIYAERHSEITIVEDYIGIGDNSYFNTAVTETFLGDESHVTHVKLQRESKKAIHISRIASLLGRGSNYNSYAVSIGALLFRNEPLALVDAENAHATLDGLVMISGDQISDTHSTLDHLKPNCTSHQLHKVVAHGNAKSVFNGKIFVRKDSQLIDAFQENRNLLLSPDATVFTKPQLEIFADDVKCSHGATIGQLSEEELFYLMSRGLSQGQSTQLLTYGFALEVIDNLPIESLRKQLSNEVDKLTTNTSQLAETA